MPNSGRPPPAVFLVRWSPLVAALIVSVAVNAVPAVRAFVFEEPAWMQAGWALYFVSLPFAAVLLVGALFAALLNPARTPGTAAAIAGTSAVVIVLTGVAFAFFFGLLS